MAVVLCQACNQYFRSKRSDAKWCDKCRELKNDEKSKRFEERNKQICIDCGKPVYRRSARCRICDNKARTGYYRAENNPNWRGGKTHFNGYVYLRVGSSKERHHAYRGEHILVWEKANDKPLPKGWVVHHLNGIKDDNRIENLLAISRKLHTTRMAFEYYEKRIRELEKQLNLLNQIRWG